jgi:enolase-phosphatase E1
MSASKTAILTDIEGTTTDVAFVHTVLFPYAARALPDFLRANAERADVAAEIAAVRVGAGKTLSLEQVIATLLTWIKEDRKETALKTLQGLVWAAGYASGELVSPIYPDAAAGLKRWKGQGRTLAVYSSGSEAAQKLLFGHSDAGDLTPLFSRWFDTRVGPKLAADSYRAIARRMRRARGSILFLSDHPGEVAAALAAGLKSVRIDRARAPDAGPETVDGQIVYGGFARIDPEDPQLSS